MATIESVPHRGVADSPGNQTVLGSYPSLFYFGEITRSHERIKTKQNKGIGLRRGSQYALVNVQACLLFSKMAMETTADSEGLLLVTHDWRLKHVGMAQRKAEYWMKSNNFFRKTEIADERNVVWVYTDYYWHPTLSKRTNCVGIRLRLS